MFLQHNALCPAGWCPGRTAMSLLLRRRSGWVLGFLLLVSPFLPGCRRNEDPQRPDKKAIAARYHCRVSENDQEWTLDNFAALDNDQLGKLAREIASVKSLLLELQGTKVNADGMPHLQKLV